MNDKKIEIELIEFEDKIAKTGRKYTRFKTSDGWMSCFIEELIADLKKVIGQKVICNIAIDEDKGFKNIRGCEGLASGNQQIAGVPVQKVNVEVDKKTTMYVSYCKDLIVSGMDEENAIKTIKNIQKAFE
jgi:hypothetical protein